MISKLNLGFLKSIPAIAGIAMTLFSTNSYSDNVLLIYDPNISVQASLNAGMSDHIISVCGPANSYTKLLAPPANKESYDQIWDLRNVNPNYLTNDDNSSYLAYLQNAGRLLFLGENGGFMKRNNSLIDFVNYAGGGQLSFAVLGDTPQTINPPFTLGGATSVTFAAAGGSTTAGTGRYATETTTGGTVITWLPSQLSNAPNGKLLVAFDTFPQTNTSTPGTEEFLKSVCRFMEISTIVTVTAPTSINTATKPTIAGKVSYPGATTKLAITITSATNSTYGPYITEFDPVSREYSIQAPELPLGTYTVEAKINGKSSTTTMEVIEVPTTLSVSAPTNLDTNTAPTFSGVVKNPGTATTVAITITSDGGQVYGPYLAQINSSTGQYSLTSDKLPRGNYTVTASVNGSVADATFVVSAASPQGNSATPVPALGQWSLALLASLFGGLAIWRQRHRI